MQKNSESKSKNIYLFVYGSLRKNSKLGYNFNRFGGQDYIRSHTVFGFKMFDLGAYPAIVEGDDNDKINGEIHKVESDSFNMIRKMELGAGYVEKKIDIEGESVSLFHMKNLTGNYKQVKNGNWDE